MEATKQTTFYDQHPFDWVVPSEETDIKSVVSPLLVELIKRLDANSLVLDVGCGPGRVLGFLARRKIRCIGIDRSYVSVGRAVARYERPGVVADNLCLPFADAIADTIVSDGVIHHTEDPRAAFAENLRVLKPGGQMYLGVYKPFGRYQRLYGFPGRQIRAGLKRVWTRPFVFIAAQVPYFVIHFVKSRGKRTWKGAQNLFYDYFVTPRVAFLSRDVIEQWSDEQGANVMHFDENRGSNVHSFILLKGIATKTHGPDAKLSHSNALSI